MLNYRIDRSPFVYIIFQGVPKWIPASINHYIHLVTLIYGLKVVRKKEYYVNVMLLRFMVVKIQYREKKSCLGHPVYCAQITRS